MYLLDTNIWLELLLDQEHAEEVRRFLHSVTSDKIFITDFTIYSIGIILFKFNKREVYKTALGRKRPGEIIS